MLLSGCLLLVLGCLVVGSARAQYDPSMAVSYYGGYTVTQNYPAYQPGMPVYHYHYHYYLPYPSSYTYSRVASSGGYGWVGWSSSYHGAAGAHPYTPNDSSIRLSP
jgi:hypothetical protein